MFTTRCAFVMFAATGLLCASNAQAQHRHDSFYNPGYQLDHHDHVIRDSHGHVIGRYHHDVVRPNSRYIVPHSGHQQGTYYYSNGGYYYHPRTASIGQGQAIGQPVQVTFGSFSHVDELASRLETLTNELCLDLHYNYSHNPGFRETYREAYSVLETARFIHDAEHRNDRDAIASRLGGMDLLFHHIQDDVRGWHRHHHRQIGQLGILSKMDLIESTLHHLMNDVGVRASADPGEQAPTPGGGVEQAPRPFGN